MANYTNLTTVSLYDGIYFSEPPFMNMGSEIIYRDEADEIRKMKI